MRKICAGLLTTVIIMNCFPLGTAAAVTKNYSLVWSDEFDGTSLNTSNWTYEVGTGNNGWGNNELQYYTKNSNNISVSNGSLKIKAVKENYNGKSYTSGRIKTQGLQSFRYGKIEARIAAPTGQGLWPACWMLGNNFTTAGWPNCGEIDIFEHVNKEDKVYGTVHWDSNGYATYGGNTAGIDVAQYHTYSIEWDKEYIRWYVDGKQYHEILIKDNAGGTEEFQKEFFLLLNLAVGGNWPGSPNSATTFPATMSVDYIRVYQNNGSGAGYTSGSATGSGNTGTNTGTGTATGSGTSTGSGTATGSGTSTGSGTAAGSGTSINSGATTGTGSTTGSGTAKTTNGVMTYKSTNTSSVTLSNVLWADIHYKINNGTQQNVRMTQNGTSATYTLNGLKANDVVTYWFTSYDTSTGTAKDGSSNTYTHTAANSAANSYSLSGSNTSASTNASGVTKSPTYTGNTSGTGTKKPWYSMWHSFFGKMF